MPARLNRPLDFLVVSDHAENLGLAPAIAESNPELLKNEWGKMQHDLVRQGGRDGAIKAYDNWMAVMGQRKDPLKEMTALAETMWQKETAAAEKYNEPGRFTALIGYEWTSNPDGNNLHRNVIFRDGKDKADQIVPFSQYDSIDAEDLWKWMADYEEKTGGRVLAIPHGGNLSNGLMFDDVTLTTKKPLDRDYAERRAKWEPLYEVTQIKGTGEAHPTLSTRDEFADFEIWDKGSFGPAGEDAGHAAPRVRTRSVEAWPRLRSQARRQPVQVRHDRLDRCAHLARHHRGEQLLRQGGHSRALRRSDPVRGGDHRPSRAQGTPDLCPRDRRFRPRRPCGRARTRARRCGKRWPARRSTPPPARGCGARVRRFGFHGRPTSTAPTSPSTATTTACRWAAISRPRPAGKAPSFLIRALRDPDGANLDRIQIIKGWLDADGKTQERVYDVAWSGDRQARRRRQAAAPVGNTVNVEEATYTNAIGAAALAGLLEGPGVRSHPNARSTTCACSKFRRRAGRRSTPRSSA